MMINIGMGSTDTVRKKQTNLSEQNKTMKNIKKKQQHTNHVDLLLPFICWNFVVTRMNNVEFFRS